MAQILVVDDHTGIRMLLQEVLTHEGHTVETAETGQEACNLIQEFSYDLLLLDYQLPVLNGLEVIFWMKEQEIRVPTIFMSGISSELPEALLTGDLTERIIQKPFNLQEICTEVRNILDRA